MKDLIRALEIFLKYGDVKYPFHCEHDILLVCGYEQFQISEEDTEELESLGFTWDDERGGFRSFRYGSC